MIRSGVSFWMMAVAVLIFYSPPAHAYIDPGIAFGLIQALFAFVFGGITVWVLRPWTYLKGVFRAKTAKDQMASNTEQANRKESSS